MKDSSPKKPGKSFMSKLARFILRFFLYGLLISILYILLCKWINPPVTITQLVSAINGNGLQRDHVSLQRMSPYVKLAIIAAEDQLFPDHDGFDFKSIEKARKHNKKGKSLRGASTISQQVAKNVFLWQHGGYFRKGLEVYFTFMIETLWSKKRILEVYLNEAQMGDGVFGVEAASKKYFRKPASNLTRTQSAMIAACLPNPKGYTVKPLSKHVASRYPWILRQMNNLQADPDIKELIKN